jgi:20S proteasome alpha/beta subunit
MTLLVGILCEGGAVIAADRQVSHGSLGRLTVGHAATKIHKLADTILFASSGPVGLGQQLAHVFENNAANITARSYFSIMPQLQQNVRGILGPAFLMATQAQSILGQAAHADVLCNSLLAAVFQDGLKLIEISHQGGFEHLTHDVPYVCVGSGKANADPFINFLWSVYWGKDRRPSVQGAVLTAYWTVKAAIEAHTFGVGFDPDVVLLSESLNGSFSVKEYSAEELLEHDDFIEQARDALRGLRDNILDRSQAAAARVADDPPPMLPPT